MRIKSFYIVGMTALVLSGCSSENDAVMSYSQEANTIKIGTYIQQGTRAASKETFADGDAIGLYACQTTGDYAGSYSANFMNNVVVTNGSGGWTYSPLSSWPTDANEHLSFVAYCPQKSTSTALTYPFTLGVDDNGLQIDPLWCTVKDAGISDRNGTAINGSEADAAFTPTTGSLNLKFKHMLSRIKVKVKLDGNYSQTVSLNSLILNDVYTGGTYTIASDLASGSWGSLSNLADLTIKSATETNVAINAQETEVCDTLMIPQNVSGGTAYLSLSYTHTLAEGGTKTVAKNIYLPGSWEPNKIYNYVISLSLDVSTITVSAEVLDMEATDDPVIGDKPAEAVDLGLSVKWASYDYGAMSPYDDSPEFVFSDSRVSSGSNLPASQDRASEWGSNWSTPTREQWSELVSNCTITSTTINGVSGYLVTAQNGNSIFLGVQDYWTSSYYYYHSSYSDYYYYDIVGKTYYNTSNYSEKFRVRPVFK